MNRAPPAITWAPAAYNAFTSSTKTTTLGGCGEFFDNMIHTEIHKHTLTHPHKQHSAVLQIHKSYNVSTKAEFHFPPSLAVISAMWYMACLGQVIYYWHWMDNGSIQPITRTFVRALNAFWRAALTPKSSTICNNLTARYCIGDKQNGVLLVVWVCGCVWVCVGAGWRGW